MALSPVISFPTSDLPWGKLLAVTYVPSVLVSMWLRYNTCTQVPVIRSNDNSIYSQHNHSLHGKPARNTRRKEACIAWLLWTTLKGILGHNSESIGKLHPHLLAKCLPILHIYSNWWTFLWTNQRKTSWREFQSSRSSIDLETAELEPIDLSLLYWKSWELAKKLVEIAEYIGYYYSLLDWPLTQFSTQYCFSCACCMQ